MEELISRGGGGRLITRLKKMFQKSDKTVLFKQTF